LSDLISVIIPAFNAERYVAEAVESVHQQGGDALEIIVVDDGSSDQTAEIAAELPRIHLLRQAHQGVAAARNAGIRASTGDYLAFLDADDLWAQGKLHAQRTILRENSNVHIVAGRVEEFYDNHAQLEQRDRRQSGDRAYTIGALLVRRADFLRVGLLDPAIRFGEFMDWRSRALTLGLKEVVLDQVVLRRRIHDRNTTRLAHDHKRHYLATIRAHLQRTRLAETSQPTGKGRPS